LGAEVKNKELIALVAARANLSEFEADNAIASMVEHMIAALADGQRVSIPGFGSFEAKQRSERSGRNPLTGEALVIPARRAVVFKPGKQLKQAKPLK